jgi:hypothetical protein
MYDCKRANLRCGEKVFRLRRRGNRKGTKGERKQYVRGSCYLDRDPVQNLTQHAREPSARTAYSPYFFYFLFSRYRNLVCRQKLKVGIPIFDKGVIRPKTNLFNGEPCLFPPEGYTKRRGTPLPYGNWHRSDEWSQTSPSCGRL